MNKSTLRLIGLYLAATCTQGSADNLSEVPAPWHGKLLPVAETDLSGAERLMQEAVPAARDQVSELLAQEQPDPDELAGAYGRLGALFLLLEIEAKADLCFRNARTLQPQEFRWPYYRGYLAMMAGNGDRALDELEAAETIDSTYPTLYLRLGKVHLDRNELPEAKAALTRVADVPGLGAAANYYLGQIAVMERHYQDAATLLEQALAENPEAHQVHYPLAQAYRALGENELAREHLSRFEQREPVAEDPLLDQLKGLVKRSLPAFKKGIYAIRRGNYAQAAERFAEGLAVDPKNAPARVSFARALYLSGRSEQARKELDRALEAQPSLILANFLRAVLDQELGDLEGASRQYRRTLELDPNHAGAMFYLANLQFSRKDYAAAARNYASALTADADIPPARLLELMALSRTGETEADVLATLQRSMERYPEDPMLQYALARMLASARDPGLRRPDQALDLANRLALTQPIPPHRRLQTLALASAGDFAQAAEIQRQIIAMSVWTASPSEQAVMQEELAAFERDELPGHPWPEGDILLSPPPFDPVAPFRDYPAAVPY